MSNVVALRDRERVLPQVHVVGPMGELLVGYDQQCQ